MTNAQPLTRTQAEAYRSRVRGCLAGGAIGDALGAPVEFMSLEQIRAQCGERGVREYQLARFGDHAGYGLVTDDTQMTLFTVEGLIRAGIRRDRGIGFTVAMVHASLDAWLDTQIRPGPPAGAHGWLRGERWLYARRAPGQTCLSALAQARGGAGQIARYGGQAVNDSKGCGGVMRSAPFGLLPTADLAGPGNAARGSCWTAADLFGMAAEAAGYTHGHPTGRLAAGTLAALISRLVAGTDLAGAVDAALRILAGHDGHEETAAALTRAIRAAAAGPPGAAAVAELGEGWVAEEALAIAVYAALAYPAPEQFADALALAVTHSGDSDSTGAICGNILGAAHGETALPPLLAFEVEGRAAIAQLAEDFVWEFTAPGELHGDYGPSTRWTTRY
jgi:ADP-ribosylglycohydrolase